MEQDKNTHNLTQLKKITWIGIFVNIGLAGIKFFVGYVGASQAVIADAVHSLSDLATDLAVIFGIKFWSAPPDQDHPYGHLRIEALITTAIGLVLVIVAVGLGYKSLATIREPHIQQTTWVAIIGPSISIVLKEILYRWTIIVGTQAKSTAVIANAWHHRSDALSSLPALLAVTASTVNRDWAFIDHIGALIISVFILKVSWDIIRPALLELADRGASLKDSILIRSIAMDVNGVQDVHAIRTRKFGPNLYVDLHILVDPEISVRAGHSISEEVQKVLLANGPDVLDVVVHVEPDE
ncbi:MAG TPA: cation diffusion facilitator family transporter [Desulfatiglandales bacterium]|nr:cation diffusion facilitator family transporter [Desulfatiglandales bacterium]